ncbi:MAG: hypothetical protein IPM02_26040 [Betaproteobacteria bacterium]|nr:hypothetical protein [Betaproteobacteria bacterium]
MSDLKQTSTDMARNTAIESAAFVNFNAVAIPKHSPEMKRAIVRELL